MVSNRVEIGARVKELYGVIRGTETYGLECLCPRPSGRDDSIFLEYTADVLDGELKEGDVIQFVGYLIKHRDEKDRYFVKCDTITHSEATLGKNTVTLTGKVFGAPSIYSERHMTVMLKLLVPRIGGTDYMFRCLTWGRLAQNVLDYLRDGQEITVAGFVGSHVGYQGNTISEVKVVDVEGF